MRANLQPQLFPEFLALIEAPDELFQDTHHNRAVADALDFGPFLESDSRLCAFMEELGEW
jgi:hypothetical protein